MNRTLGRPAPFMALFFLAPTLGCKEEPAPQRVAPPTAAVTQTASKGVLRLPVAEKGAASFLIDAPLEKIKGHSGKFRGQLSLDPADLKSTRGQIDVDLSDLVTETFDDAGKNTAQTGHAHNWMEIGTDVEAKRREENRWARFTIQSIDEVSSAKLAEAPEQGGERTVTVTARGDLWAHGATSPKTVKLKAAFVGPADAPTGIHLSTREPLSLSLKEHDIKPRDVAGTFLNGALEKVGKKIDDTVQISLDFTAGSGKS